MELRLAFAVTETGPDAAAGDYFTAIELGTALSDRYDWTVSYLRKDVDWYDLQNVDVLISMCEDFNLRLIKKSKSSLITVAWARNWFDRWCNQPWIAEYSIILASSKIASDFMGLRLGRYVWRLPIATNDNKFGKLHRYEKDEFDFVFTGSYWGSKRDVDYALRQIDPKFHGAIFGRHWEKVPELTRLYRGFISYEDLPGIYGRSTVVIDDANHATKVWGAANSRVFDALAAGCLVITNSQTVSDEFFDSELPVYGSADHLQALLTDYLARPDARSFLVERLQSKVLHEHTYAQRAVALRSLLRLKGR